MDLAKVMLQTTKVKPLLKSLSGDEFLSDIGVDRVRTESWSAKTVIGVRRW
jgi:hypothetical protein